MPAIAPATVLSNARLVLPDRVVEAGWVAMAEGLIADLGADHPPAGAQDVAGDFIIPGLIELHTDHLEAHYMPRPKVFWDPVAAVVSYDAQLASCGITTVLDSLRVWREEGADKVGGEAPVLAAAIATARDAGMLRITHFLHLRCEVPMPDVVADAAALIGRPDVRLVSLMDHTPGQRQFRDEEKLRTYYRSKSGGLTDAEVEALFAQRRAFAARHAAANYRGLVALARLHGTRLASHDDTTLEHVRQSIADAVAIAEFPTTLEAAAASHAAGIAVLMGAPNLVRGSSHSGNVGTAELARAGLLDVMSSDYMPSSLLMAAFRLPQAAPAIDLPRAIATVTAAPAAAVGLDDRGTIALGKRADLLRVRLTQNIPVVGAVWRAGSRIA